MAYTYKTVPLGVPTARNYSEVAKRASDHLAYVIGVEAHGGWEYYRVENISVYIPAGCLSLFGRSDGVRIIQVAVFRRPAAET